MNANWVPDFNVLLVLGVAACAVIERSRLAAARDEAAARAGRRMTLGLAAGGWALYLALAALMGVAVGSEALHGFLFVTMAVWLVPLLALGALVEAGATWADRIGRDPFVAIGSSPASSSHPTIPTGPTGQTGRTASPLRGRRLLGVALAVTAMLGWTALLFVATRERLLAPTPDPLRLSALPPALRWIFLAMMLALAPIVEEAIFRHYLLYRLAAWLRKGPAPRVAPIMLTSLAFAACHASLLLPYGVKFAQTAVLGAILGVLAWREGLVAAIAAHALFNLALIAIALIAQ